MRKKYIELILDLVVDVFIAISAVKLLGIDIEVSLLMTILFAIRKNHIFSRS